MPVHEYRKANVKLWVRTIADDSANLTKTRIL